MVHIWNGAVWNGAQWKLLHCKQFQWVHYIMNRAPFYVRCKTWHAQPGGNFVCKTHRNSQQSIVCWCIVECGNAPKWICMYLVLYEMHSMHTSLSIASRYCVSKVVQCIIVQHNLSMYRYIYPFNVLGNAVLCISPYGIHVFFVEFSLHYSSRIMWSEWR